MKFTLSLFFLISWAFALGQSHSYQLDWQDSQTLAVGQSTITVPAFKDHLVYENGNILFSDILSINGSIDPLSARLSNLQTEIISRADLQDLDESNLPVSPNLIVGNALSRKRNYIQIQLHPIYRSNGNIYRVTSFTANYSMATATAAPKNTTLTNSILASGDWYRFKVEQTGVHRITQGFLSSLGMDVDNIDPRNLKIYGQGGTSLPLTNEDNRFYDPAEIAIRVNGSADGSLDSGDEVLFYAVASDTEFIEDNDSFINPYDDDTYYYITASGGAGKRIAAFNQPTQAPTVTYTSYEVVKHVETDERNIGQIGRLWYGERFSIEPEQSFTLQFDNVLASRPARLRITTGAISDIRTSMSFSINGQSLGVTSYTGLSNDNISVARRNTLINNTDVNLTSDEAVVTLSYDNAGNPGAQAYLDYIRIDAYQELTGIGKQFKFYVPESAVRSGVAQYAVSNASEISAAWDITDRFNIRSIENIDNAAQFNFNAPQGSLRTYQAVVPSDYHSPVLPQDARVGNQNLKGTIFNNSGGSFVDIDYLIITPDFLQNQAQRLANYHIRDGNLNTKVVLLQDIYNEFSEGKQDISAIRNFVKYVYDNASDPSRRVQYLNMFGDTSFDYKDRIAVKDNIVPSFLSANSTSTVGSYCTDDFFTYMDPEEGTGATNNLMDIAVGRMIVSTQQEAREMVDKIVSYTARPAFERWRNDVTLIGDDVDIPSDDILQESVNQLADDITENRPDYNVRKILLDSYDQVSTAGGERYPDAVDDIRNAFEQGSLVINYFGHGNEDGLSQEFVVTQSLVRNLRNANTLPLFITVTCEFTRYDNPLRTSGGEITYLNPQGGAISLVATNRLIFISVGVTLNDTLDQYLFGFNNVEPISMAEALRLAKTDPALARNGTRRVVAFIGDPALKLAFPSPRVALTAINGQPIVTANDQPQLRALDRATVSGEVQDLSGRLIPDYNGTVSVTLFDKPIDRTTFANDNSRDSDGDIIKLNFDQQGEVLFRGQATVENGLFNVEFVLPRDTQIPLGNGRLSFYAQRDQPLEDQNGFSEQVIIGGINEDAPEDNVGPEIELFMNDRNFVSGGITDPNPLILAFLEDMNGINTASGIGHDIIGILDGDETNPFILNDYYEADVDDFTRGKVFFPLRDIEPGLHTLTVKGWDTYNNSSTQEIQFVVAAGDGIELTRVLNYPNPFSTYTEFWFNHNRPFEPLDVQVQVMTVTGKVVWTQNQIITTTGFTSREITWDGMDDFGQRLAKGVYIYKITVKSSLANETASKIEKLVIL
ncbi:type IX secretion system sortase PorU [Nonlabens ponticola]|uniref:Type IX secretion system sortase PorU n=1 Tax=Nonlabens ponticola TaxID=2496866 RepID=A0A3S9MWN2_9FLAO|nr:type IX secretion system sortase PorU [Nonlabens ponticola]AZQ43625.1 type IX secretion system sortase PorU [Nonlabens ponticola]